MDLFTATYWTAAFKEFSSVMGVPVLDEVKWVHVFCLYEKTFSNRERKKKTAVEIIEETVWEKEQAERGTTNNLPGQTRAGKAASFLPYATITRGCSSECSRGIFSSNLRGNATSGTIEVIGEQRGSRLVFPDPCGAALTGTPRAMLDTRSRSKSASFECVTWGVCVCVWCWMLVEVMGMG